MAGPTSSVFTETLITPFAKVAKFEAFPEVNKHINPLLTYFIPCLHLGIPSFILSLIAFNFLP